MKAKINVLFVCYANTCRSPLGEGVFQHCVNQQNLTEQFHVDSAGTHCMRVGGAPHPNSIQVAQEHNFDIQYQEAQQLELMHLAKFDYILAMDESNYQNINSLATAYQKEKLLQGKLYLLRHFDRQSSKQSVPDPIGSGVQAYQQVYQIIEESCQNLLQFILQQTGSTTIQ